MTLGRNRLKATYEITRLDIRDNIIKERININHFRNDSTVNKKRIRDII